MELLLSYTQSYAYKSTHRAVYDIMNKTPTACFPYPQDIWEGCFIWCATIWVFVEGQWWY